MEREKDKDRQALVRKSAFCKKQIGKRKINPKTQKD